MPSFSPPMNVYVAHKQIGCACSVPRSSVLSHAIYPYRYWFNFLNCLLCCSTPLTEIAFVYYWRAHTYIVHTRSGHIHVCSVANSICIGRVWHHSGISYTEHRTRHVFGEQLATTCEWKWSGVEMESNVHYIYFLIHYWYGKRRRKFIMYVYIVSV